MTGGPIHWESMTAVIFTQQGFSKEHGNETEAPAFLRRMGKISETTKRRLDFKVWFLSPPPAALEQTFNHSLMFFLIGLLLVHLQPPSKQTALYSYVASDDRSTPLNRYLSYEKCKGGRN